MSCVNMESLYTCTYAPVHEHKFSECTRVYVLLLLQFFCPFSLPAALPVVESVLETPVLYFTNNSYISKLENSLSSVVLRTQATTNDNALSIDCNSCDGKIYWASPEEGAIKRGIPMDDDSIEVVRVFMSVW